MKWIITAITVAASGPVLADVEVTFRDGAPKDRFTITNLAECPTQEFVLRIDLVTTKADAIFDTQEGAPGEAVFQPVEIVTGQDLVTFISDVPDGAIGLTLRISNIKVAGAVAFTADIDDTASTRGITVSGSEIEGGRAVIDTGAALLEGVFDDTGRAVVPMDACALS